MKKIIKTVYSIVAIVFVLNLMATPANAQRYRFGGERRGYSHYHFNNGYPNNYGGGYYSQPIINMPPPMLYNYGCRPRFYRRWHHRWGW